MNAFCNFALPFTNRYCILQQRKLSVDPPLVLFWKAYLVESQRWNQRWLRDALSCWQVTEVTEVRTPEIQTTHVVYQQLRLKTPKNAISAEKGPQIQVRSTNQSSWLSIVAQISCKQLVARERWHLFITIPGADYLLLAPSWKFKSPTW